MGNWVMHVEGHGIHDNGREDDADSMLKEFAGSLRAAGHEVHAVSFATGTVRVLQDTGSAEAPASEYEYRP